MDLNRFDTKSPSEKGAFLHLRDPFLGHLLYTGEGVDKDYCLLDPDNPHDAIPVGADVRGFESPSIQDLHRKLKKKQLKDPLIWTEEQLGLELACALVIRFHGITVNGVPLGDTKDEKMAFFKQSDHVVLQVRRFAETRVNFFGNVSSD